MGVVIIVYVNCCCYIFVKIFDFIFVFSDWKSYKIFYVINKWSFYYKCGGLWKDNDYVFKL